MGKDEGDEGDEGVNLVKITDGLKVLSFQVLISKNKGVSPQNPEVLLANRG
ncbi:MAG: hypothetical protein KME52_16050 [Desmonostoc geniculatum HA4340-LM1]|nr:hypothetical protein [Desmonostoc geniculatum HA4340-LM1]